MPSQLTELTEIVTGLGTLGIGSIDEVLEERPATVVNVASQNWKKLAVARAAHQFDEEFEQAWMNGKSLFEAMDGLRYREPNIVEWKGPHRPPGYDALPVDLRIDHVFLVSCKYLSKVLCNSSPEHVFDELLVPRPASRGLDWFKDVAPAEFRALYRAVRKDMAGSKTLPSRPEELDQTQREAIKSTYVGAWPEEILPKYESLCSKVSTATATRWKENLQTRVDKETLLWRMLRIGASPYFVLGATHGQQPLRLRIATPWDWRQLFELRRFRVFAMKAGQPKVGWEAIVRRRKKKELSVRGHVEIRWSHGRFCGNPEAKVYLDSPFEEVPGYFQLK